VLAAHRIVHLTVKLSQSERQRYDALIDTRNRFLQDQGIRLGSLTGWQAFVKASARSRAGRSSIRPAQVFRIARMATSSPNGSRSAISSPLL
jgi:hypothetical protein